MPDCLDKSVCGGSWDNCELGCLNPHYSTDEPPFWLSEEGIKLAYACYQNQQKN